MVEKKLNVEAVIDSVKPTLDELIISEIWKSNPKRVDVCVDKSGNIQIDKNSELYDWAVNG
jgi:hypothetical protein